MILVNMSSLEWIRVNEQKGRARLYQGPGVAVDYLEVEGPLNDQWPSKGHEALFGTFPLKHYAPAANAHDAATLPDRLPPVTERRRDSTWPAGMQEHGKVDGVWTVESWDAKGQARALLKDFLPKAFRRPVSQEQVERYGKLAKSRLAAGDCFEDAMRMAY